MQRHSSPSRHADTTAAMAPTVERSVHEETPFAPFQRALDTSRLVFLSAAGIHLRTDPPFSPDGDPDFNGLRIIPRDTPAREIQFRAAFTCLPDAEQDLNCVLPLERLRELETEGLIGAIGPRHFSLSPWMVPESPAFEQTMHRLSGALEADRVDLVFGAPVCARTTSLVNRALRQVEACGIPTVGLSVDRQASETVPAPRTLLVHFPAGCPFGSARNRSLQRNVLLDCLDAVAHMAPGQIVELPYRWVAAES